MDLRQRIWADVRRLGLLRPGEAVLVGVSGGPDSLCLLDVLHRLSAAQRWRVSVAHFDHGLRPEAGEEAEFVRAEAAARGLACAVEAADTRAYAQAQGLSLEDAARRLRYDFLARAAQAAGARYVAVAHTADDQAETVLMHLLRGGGLAGLKGMAARAPLPGCESLWLIRPLLGVTRADVEAYCAAHGLTPRRDPTNQDEHYLRNWVREAALPFLEERNPNLRRTLARTAEVLAGEYGLAEAAVDAAWERAAPEGWQAEGQAVFDRAGWRGLSAALRRGLLRRALRRLRGSMRDVDFAPLDAAARFGARAAAGRSCEVAGGLKLHVLADRLVLAAELPETEAGGPRLDDGGGLAAGWRLEVERREAGGWEWAEVSGAGTWEVFVDAARVKGPLVVRARRHGERFYPLGLGGHSARLTDYMVNAKTPRAQRARWPVVACGDEVVWLAGLRLDERFKVGPETKAVLRLSFRRGEAQA